jgi:TPR repeat protein
MGVIFQTDDRDLAKAVHHYEIAAAAGNPRAQNNLGMMYSRGQGVAQDYDRAFPLFQQAASVNLPSAIRNLGVMYENGFGVPFDEKKAHELYKRAGQNTQQQFAAAIASVGSFTDPRITLPPISEMPNLLKLANTGDIVAQYSVAMLLHSGEIPNVPSNQVVKWMLQAAQAGFVDARAKLSLMYLSGTGVPQDYIRAYAWMSMASASGFTHLKDLQIKLTSLMTNTQIAHAQRFAAKQWNMSLN